MNYLIRSSSQRGYTAHAEPRFDVDKKSLKPDIVLYNAGSTTVIDVQVINDQYSLEAAHNNKLEKYAPLTTILSGQRTEHRMTTLTLNWRGAICRSSAEDLLCWGVISKKDLKILTVRGLEGSAAMWRAFQNMTTRRSRAPKQGIG